MDCKTNCVKMMNLGKKNVSKQQNMRVQFHLITILIPNQALHHPKQRHHILDHRYPKKVLDTIKKLHFRCNDSDNIEQLYILPSRWLSQLKYEKIGDAIHEKFQNVSCTLIKFFVEENLVSWHPQIHSDRNYLQSFYLAALIHKCGGNKQYSYAEIRNFTAGRRTRSFQKGNDNNGTSSSSSDNEFTPKYKKSYGENINANFNAFMDKRCEELIEADIVLF